MGGDGEGRGQEGDETPPFMPPSPIHISGYAPGSSGLGDVIHTTSENTSGQPLDQSTEASAVEMCWPTCTSSILHTGKVIKI